MGFVGNYAPRGLSPQMYDMPVIQQKGVAQTVQLPDFQVDPEGHDPTTFGL